MVIRPRFPLGRMFATPGALQALNDAMISGGIYFGRHAAGDWGEVDSEDWGRNNRALENGERLLSAYTLPNTGVTIWIITEADRSSSTMLLPEEY